MEFNDRRSKARFYGASVDLDDRFRSAQMEYFQDITNAGMFLLQGELRQGRKFGDRQLRISCENLLKNPEEVFSQITSISKVSFNDVDDVYSQEGVISGMKPLPSSLTIGDHKLLNEHYHVESNQYDEWRKCFLPEQLPLLPATANLVKGLGYEVEADGDLPMNMKWVWRCKNEGRNSLIIAFPDVTGTLMRIRGLACDVASSLQIPCLGFEIALAAPESSLLSLNYRWANGSDEQFKAMQSLFYWLLIRHSLCILLGSNF